MPKYYLYSAFGLLLTGCSVGSDYQTPQLPSTSEQRFSDTEFTDPTQPVHSHWWRLYQDHNLNELVTQALQANQDLQAAEANVIKARSALSESQSRRLPSTDMAAGVTYGDATQTAGSPSGSVADEQWSRSASLAIGWEADLLGRVSNAIDAAKANEQVMIAARDAVRVWVAAETTAAYLNACSYSHAIDVQQNALTNNKEQVKLLDAQHQVGSISASEQATALALIARARANLQQLQGQRQAALYRLTALLGQAPSEVPSAAKDCQRPPTLANQVPVGDIPSLIRQRPDLRQAERQLAADSAMVNVRIAELYPSISIGATGSYINNDSISSGDAFSYFFGPLLSWRFPNVAKTNAQIDQAEAQVDASYATFQQRIMDALAEVETAISNVRTEKHRNQSLQRAMEGFAQAYRLEQKRFKAGSSSFREVLDKQQELLTARRQFVQSLRSLNTYHVGLFKALGGSWSERESTDTTTQEG